MIPEQEIRVLARKSGVMPRIIEKDYHLGLLLRSISKDKAGKYFIFKGGTALRKCYFKNYRFSEDIDFTVTSRALNREETLKDLVTSWCVESNQIFGTSFRLLKLSLELK